MDPTHTCPRGYTSGFGSGKIETAIERTGWARRVEVFPVMKAPLSQGEIQDSQGDWGWEISVGQAKVPNDGTDTSLGNRGQSTTTQDNECGDRGGRDSQSIRNE